MHNGSDRRNWMKATAAAAALAAIGLSPAAYGQSKIKVAAVYTVPVEQQWVSRIHKALNEAKSRGEIDYVFSESVSNADYERVMRQYAEQGSALIVGESFAVEGAARRGVHAKALAAGVFIDGQLPAEVIDVGNFRGFAPLARWWFCPCGPPR